MDRYYEGGVLRTPAHKQGPPHLPGLQVEADVEGAGDLLAPIVRRALHHPQLDRRGRLHELHGRPVPARVPGAQRLVPYRQQVERPAHSILGECRRDAQDQRNDPFGAVRVHPVQEPQSALPKRQRQGPAALHRRHRRRPLGSGGQQRGLLLDGHGGVQIG